MKNIIRAIAFIIFTSYMNLCHATGVFLDDADSIMISKLMLGLKTDEIRKSKLSDNEELKNIKNMNAEIIRIIDKYNLNKLNSLDTDPYKDGGKKRLFEINLLFTLLTITDKEIYYHDSHEAVLEIIWNLYKNSNHSGFYYFVSTYQGIMPQICEGLFRSYISEIHLKKGEVTREYLEIAYTNLHSDIKRFFEEYDFELCQVALDSVKTSIKKQNYYTN